MPQLGRQDRHDVINVDFDSRGESERSRRLNQTKLGAMTLRTYMEGRQDTEAWMQRQQNCGRRTIRELRAALAKHAPELSADISLDDCTSHLSDTIDKVSAPLQGADTLPVGGCIRDLVDWHLANLPARTAEFLRQRFGLDCKPQTLAEIGEIHSLTRERIRQIERRGLSGSG